MGYIGAGTFESPYKTMGKFDNNMDTAWLHYECNMAQLVLVNAGIAGNFEGQCFAYHGTYGTF
jgi:hypothetical protein